MGNFESENAGDFADNVGDFEMDNVEDFEPVKPVQERSHQQYLHDCVMWLK